MEIVEYMPSSLELKPKDREDVPYDDRGVELKYWVVPRRRVGGSSFYQSAWRRLVKVPDEVQLDQSLEVQVTSRQQEGLKRMSKWEGKKSNDYGGTSPGSPADTPIFNAHEAGRPSTPAHKNEPSPPPLPLRPAFFFL